MSYTELQVTTNFSFLRGASHPEELVEQAAAFGYKEIAITDRNSFAGIVRAHVAAKKKGIRIIPGCRLDLLDGPALLAYPTNRNAYSQLSTLLTTGNLRAEKGECHLYKADVYEHAKGCKFIVLPPAVLNEDFEFDHILSKNIKGISRSFWKQSLYRSIPSYTRAMISKYLYRFHNFQHELKIPLVATNDVHYHQSRTQAIAGYCYLHP